MLFQVTKTKMWHKIYLRIEQGDTEEDGIKRIVDIVKIVVDCKLYDKIVLETPREPEMNLNGYTSVGRDINGDKIRVLLFSLVIQWTMFLREHWGQLDRMYLFSKK